MEFTPSATAREQLTAEAFMGKKFIEAEARILIASDSVTDADLVRNLLASEYENLFISTEPDRSAADFENHCPDVIVLAFNDLRKSEGYYLGLFRLSEKIHQQPHRTIILCAKDDVRRAYQACRKEYFDDYILFWPMTNDAPRLLMSVHHALRDLRTAASFGPSSAEFAMQARRLSDLGNLLDRQMHQGSQQIDIVSDSISQAKREINVALDLFSGKLARGDLLDLTPTQNTAALEREIIRLKQEEIGHCIRAAEESVAPVREWAEKFKQECAPHLESVRTLNVLSDQIPPLILVVDDDALQRKIVGRFLAPESYRLEFAGSGVEALNILRKSHPDLILMDILMSDLDGIETTRRIKVMPQFASTPVIMMTGNSEGVSVRDSVKAGATNFVVKPFDRETLLAKLSAALKAE
jgi:CheY-like chemotaxis protein